MISGSIQRRGEQCESAAACNTGPWDFVTAEDQVTVGRPGEAHHSAKKGFGMTQEPACPASLSVKLAGISDDLAGPQRPRTPESFVPTLGATIDAPSVERLCALTPS